MTASNAAQASAPYMSQANQAVQQQAFKNTVGWTPYTYLPDASRVEDTLRTQTEYADLMNKEYERQQNPELYNLRESYGPRAADLFNPDQAMLDEMLRRSVIASQNTLGPAGDFGEGSTANQILMRIYGPAYQRERERQFGNLTNFLNQNPRTEVALDPSSYLNLTEGAKATATDLANQRRQEVLTSGQQTTGNTMNYNTGLMSGIIKEAGERANVKNTAQQRNMDALMQGAKLAFVEIPKAVSSFMKPSKT
jgi:hypothetical protein